MRRTFGFDVLAYQPCDGRLIAVIDDTPVIRGLRWSSGGWSRGARGRRAENQHWTVGEAKDALGDRSQEQPREPCAAMGRHHDQVTVILLRHRRDNLPRYTRSNDQPQILIPRIAETFLERSSGPVFTVRVDERSPDEVRLGTEVGQHVNYTHMLRRIHDRQRSVRTTAPRRANPVRPLLPRSSPRIPILVRRRWSVHLQGPVR